jgi:anaerobic dimethyl sulfoxide reductase subunit C (anchor subunit)
MPQNAWSLIVFTLLTQMSVGVYLVTEVLNFSYTKEFGFENLHSLRFFSRLFVLTTAILASVSSIFHLKNWGHAYHAFNNLKTSWVSKEMILFFIFVSCVALLTFMSWRKTKEYFLQRLLSIVGIFFGIALIFSMAKIYMLPTIPVWDHWTTPGFFSTSALLLGSLAIVSLYTVFFRSSKSSSQMEGARKRWYQRTLPNLVKISLGYVVACIFVSTFFIYRLTWVAEEYGADAFYMHTNKHIFFFLGILFYVLGWILLLFLLKKSRQTDGFQEKSLPLMYGAFIFIALAQILDRYLFFVSFYRIGL